MACRRHSALSHPDCSGSLSVDERESAKAAQFGTVHFDLSGCRGENSPRRPVGGYRNEGEHSSIRLTRAVRRISLVISTCRCYAKEQALCCWRKPLWAMKRFQCGGFEGFATDTEIIRAFPIQFAGWGIPVRFRRCWGWEGMVSLQAANPGGGRSVSPGAPAPSHWDGLAPQVQAFSMCRGGQGWSSSPSNRVLQID